MNPSVPLPIVNVLVVPGWKLWADPAGESAVVPSTQGSLSGFWSTSKNGLGLVVVVRMLRHHGRAGYRPRSARYARAYAAGITRITRIGAIGKPKTDSKSLGWWDVVRDEAAGNTFSNVVIGHSNGRRTIVMEGGAS